MKDYGGELEGWVWSVKDKVAPVTRVAGEALVKFAGFV